MTRWPNLIQTIYKQVGLAWVSFFFLENKPNPIRSNLIGLGHAFDQTHPKPTPPWIIKSMIICWKFHVQLFNAKA